MAAGESTRAEKPILIKSADEIKIMVEANQIVAETLSMLEKVIEPGITTFELDRLAEELCRKRNAEPAFKGYHGFPGSLCVSINDEVVHGIPTRKRKLKKGDVISIDFGVCYKGFYGDSAVTIPVGRVNKKVFDLLRVTRESLDLAIKQIVPDNRISDVSRAVQMHAESHGYAIVRQFVGHGIGSSLHEGPEVPNYLVKGQSPRLLEGMVIAVEPMVNMGTHEVKVQRDGWTVVTRDGKVSAHFEHSVAVTANGPLVLSARDSFSDKLKK